MSDHEHPGLIQELRRRFPLFDHVTGRFGESSQEERIPWFFALLLAAAMKREPGACCFVLEKTQGTTALAAVLLAFARLKEDFPLLASSYAQTALSRGQHVRVKPGNFVYEYDGVWPEHPDRFRLKEQDKQASRSFPVSKVLRLEPTTRKLPKGTLSSKIRESDRSPLDQMLDIATYGNDSMFRNVVLVHMAQARFARIAEVVSLAPRNSTHFDQLSSLLDWGTIGSGGVIQAGDAYQVVGEPLIAVCKTPQDLADAAMSAPEASKVVLVDGARGVLSDLQAFDDIVDHQRVVILASADETEEIQTLRDREWPVWYLSPTEITIGEDTLGERSRNSFVGRTVRVADVKERSSTIAINCHSDDLEAAAIALSNTAARLGKADDADGASETRDLLRRLYGILLEFSECCFGVGGEAKVDLEVAQQNFMRNRMWMAPDVAEQFQSVFARLERVSSGGSEAGDKADILLRTASGSEGRWAIACRSARAAELLRQGLHIRGVDLPVLPIQAMRPEEEWDGVILPAWPGRRIFARLRNLGIAPSIQVLTYPFEHHWLLAHEVREYNFMLANELGSRDRAKILGIEPDLLPSSKPMVPITPSDSESHVQTVFDLEGILSRRRPSRPPSSGSGDDVRNAWFVEFHGGCYALFTEWSYTYVLNDLVEGSRQEAGLRTVAIPELSVDDFVLFRAGGDKEFIRLLAEDELGLEEYEAVRAIAERWKSALHRLGSIPSEVQRRLEASGLYRTLPTIAGWMGNPDRIGPGDDSDLEIIGRAAGDVGLLESLSTVRAAIHRIRGAHQTAGNHLTQLILGEVRGRMSQLDGQPVLLDLGYGHAWVVQVRGMDTQQREYSADQVNRLLWTDD